MASRKDIIQKQLQYVIRETDFDFLGEKYSGKVRDNYASSSCRYLVTTDRLSCFDKVVACIPYKGQVLNQLALYWFRQTTDIIRNHLIESPDPNVMAVQDCKILPVEIVLRSYLAGSAWRDYESGKDVSGITLPKGLQRYEKLPETILTPSTKAEKGQHDLPISEEEVLSSGLVNKENWAKVKSTALRLFEYGQSMAKKQGLLLVDTKYEFGLVDGEIILADEVHTLDSSRYWVEESYQEKFEAGESPVMLDKEPTRQWLLDQGYMGDGPIPEFTQEHLAMISEHYIQAYEWITGGTFEPVVADPIPRISNNLREFDSLMQGAST